MPGDYLGEKAASGIGKRLKSLRRSDRAEKQDKGEKEAKTTSPNESDHERNSTEKVAATPADSNSTSPAAPATNSNGKTSMDKRRPGSNHSNPLSLNRFFPNKQQKEKRQAEEQAAKVPQSDRVRKAQELYAKQFQVDDLHRRIVEEGRKDVDKEYVRKALSSNYAAYDLQKAYELLDVQLRSDRGWIAPYDRNIALVGAENREAVTCYLAALLAAMFIRLDAYECMLLPNPSHSPAQKRLCNSIRLWVNMARLGMLIHVDQMKDLQEALADCGWPEARQLTQQDASEAFANITEALNLPLLTLEVNLFHQGKKDEDDHKVVEERLLNISVPLPSSDGPEDSEVKLEDCLEEYFNTRVEIKRDNADEKEPPSAIMPDNTIRIVQQDDDHFDQGECSSPVPMEDEATPLPPFPSYVDTSQPLEQFQPAQRDSSTTTIAESSRPITRPRTGSAIQKVVLDENNKVAGTVDVPGVLVRAGTKIARAITIPAWQIYRLVPFTHKTGKKTEPSSDREVITNLDERPVVGICLKRWSFQDGVAKKSSTVVDIPDCMSLPHFMAAENELGHEYNQQYKLVLHAVVCHRGESMHSGHYIALFRIDPKLLTDNRRHIADPPPDYEEAQWVKFDDLAQDTGGRVVCVDDIRKSLREEMPYLLFYRIERLVDVPRSSLDNGSTTEPPSYMDSTINVERGGTSNGSTSGKSESIIMPILSRQGSGYFDNAIQSSGPSIRFSLDIPGSRSSFGEDVSGIAPLSRRGSVVAQAESVAALTPAITPSAGPVTPAVATPSHESPAHKFRTAARGFMIRNKSEGHVDGKGEGKMLDMFKIGRSGSKEVLRGEIAAESQNGSPTKEDGGDVGRSRRSFDKKDKKAKGKKKTNEKFDSSERGKIMPDRECSVM